MAQANSVQREPSMEEILASIRRIIEDNDVDKQRDDDDAEPVFTAPANDATDKGVEAFRSEFRDYSVHDDTEVETTSVMPSIPIGGATAAREQTSSVEAAAVSTSAARARDAEVFARYDAAPKIGAAPAAAAVEPSLPVVDAMRDEASVPAGEDLQPRPALTSEHTGRQVAASFGELSEAFAASRRRGFDEMAEEMLRPMLQDWLDNNLPHMVERLVKEEIERIARG